MNERINQFWKLVIIGMTSIGILLTLNQIFFWNLLGITLINKAYLYAMLACFLSMVFLLFPFSKKKQYQHVSVVDVCLFLITVIINGYFMMNAENIINFGWDFQAPTLAVIFSVCQWLIVLEALRRTAGLSITIITAVFSFYPLFANKIPIYFMQGLSMDFLSTAKSHAMGAESILGLPLQATTSILIVFLLFGVVLQKTGGATFFYELAHALLGKSRGGSAKVSILSSGFLGMMSGSAVSNVLTTGPMTIPAMKKSGFEARYAAGVEATASAGGSITPPIMGTAAFLMVSFVGVPYSEIVIAAAIPAFLYFFGIYVQVDAYSAKNKLQGLPKSEIPHIGTVLKNGLPYLFTLIMLIFMIAIVKSEVRAPFYTILILLAIQLFSKNNRLNLGKLGDILFSSGRAVTEILGIIAGVGLIVGGLSLSGVSLSLARELIALVGDNVFLILIAGAITSFILGMGMTVSAVYVLLAIVMAPALIQLGIHPIAAHLFVIYWATVSYITPPVALASFAAAGIAKSPPIATSFTAMKLGAVKYVIPFFFAFNPVLVAQGTIVEIIFAFLTAIIGVFLLACAFEGWMVGIEKKLSTVDKVIVLSLGMLFIIPDLKINLAVLPFMAILLIYLMKKKQISIEELNSRTIKIQPENK